MKLPSNRTAVTSVQEARDALGKRLRELRQRAADDDGRPLGLSGRKLAESLSWPPSKISKLETAAQTPTDDDIVAWTRATNSEAEAETLLAALHTLESQHAEWQRQMRGGLRHHQQEIAELNERTTSFRAFEPTFIPGLLQTADYARYRFMQSIAVFKVRNDVDEAVRTRIDGQRILYQSDKRFRFVITEATLRYRLCPPEVMLGQLDRLISLAALPNVRLGIIPFDAPYVVAPAHGFWIMDDDRVMVETFSAELNLAQPQEIELYGQIFESLAESASYGRAARALITEVVDRLVTLVSPDDSD
jgi:hypothetical protein